MLKDAKTPSVRSCPEYLLNFGELSQIPIEPRASSCKDTHHKSSIELTMAGAKKLVRRRICTKLQVEKRVVSVDAFSRTIEVLHRSKLCPMRLSSQEQAPLATRAWHRAEFVCSFVTVHALESRTIKKSSDIGPER